MAKRIQRKRVKGWKMPEGAVYVGRPSKWGNDYSITPESRLDPYSRISAVESYKVDVARKLRDDPNWLDELRGKNLACWCPIVYNGDYVPCHADVLLSLANNIPLEDIIDENIRAATREKM